MKYNMRRRHGRPWRESSFRRNNPDPQRTKFAARRDRATRWSRRIAPRSSDPSRTIIRTSTRTACVDNKASEIGSSLSADISGRRLAGDMKARVTGDAAIVTGSETLNGSRKVTRPARGASPTCGQTQWAMAAVGGSSTIVSNDTSDTAAQSGRQDLKAKTIAGRRRTNARRRSRSGIPRPAARMTRRTAGSADEGLLVREPSSRSHRPSDPPGTPTSDDRGVRRDPRVRHARDRAGSLLWTDVKGFSPASALHARVVKEGNAWKIAAEQRTGPISAAARPKS